MNKCFDQPPFLLFASDFDSGSTELEGDCACPTSSSREYGHEQGQLLPINTTLTQISTYRMPLRGEFSVLWPSHRPPDMAVLDDYALSVWDRFATPQSTISALAGAPPSDSASLVTGLIQRFWRTGFLECLGEATTTVPYLSPSVLVAWIELTTRCNLNCTYCYVPRTRMDMSEQVGLRAIDAIVRSAQAHGYPRVKVKYAGGEPTLNFELVHALHDRARLLTARHGLELLEVLLSNGVALSVDMLDYLRDTGMRLMISLDGLGPDHDRQRPLANGAASSILVRSAIDRAIARGLAPHVSITVSPTSAGSLAETVRFVLERNLLFNLNFVRGDCACPTDPETGGRRTGWESDLIDGLLAAFAVIEESPPKRRLTDGLLDRINLVGGRSPACGVGRDYLAIDHRGDVARCHMGLDRGVCNVLADDPLSFVRLEPSEAPRLAVEGREPCQACQWRDVCGGGCPLAPRPSNYHGQLPSPYCKVYQAVLPELLRLEGLRMLEWRAAATA